MLRDAKKRDKKYSFYFKNNERKLGKKIIFSRSHRNVEEK